MKKKRQAPLLIHRKKIDVIDSKLLKLLNQRALVVARIQQTKEKKGLKIHDPNRELAILHRLFKENQGPLTDREIELIFRRILYVYRSRQRAVRNGLQKKR